MAYFEKLPEMLYNFPVGDTEKVFVVRDITANVRVIKNVLENVTLFDEYDVVDGETPEIVSEKIYDTPDFHWAIMIANNRLDYLNDWLMPYDRLQQYCIDKYGAEALYSIHHYEDENGYVVNDDYPLATPIDNITYEERINESKRRIKLISKGIIQQMINEFSKLMNQ
jgi:hypothetical protein